jgi:hypothetical protein
MNRQNLELSRDGIILIIVGGILLMLTTLALSAPAPLPRRDKDELNRSPDPKGAWDVINPHGETHRYTLFHDFTFNHAPISWDDEHSGKYWRMTDSGKLRLEWRRDGRTYSVELIWDTKKCVWSNNYDGGWVFRRRKP